MATEKRLIDINATIQNLESEIEQYPTANSNDMPFEALKKSVIPKLVRDVINYLEKEPTVDAVEVVRCKDCKHHGGVTFGNRCKCWSNLVDGWVHFTCPDDFCSYGERKTDG